MTVSTPFKYNSEMHGLSDREIVRIARKIIAEVGVDGLTMRRLSDELGVALGATYHHVANRHDLLVLVAQDLFAGVVIPPPEAGDWSVRLKAAMISVAGIVGEYPGMGSFISTHVDDTLPVHLNLTVVEMLAEAGFDTRTTMALMTALTFYVAGMCAGGFSARAARVFEGVDVQALFEDGLDLLLDGARARL